jgi:hypothetical protein
MVMNYIKSHYTGFTFRELLLSTKKASNQPFNQNLLKEIKNRIINDKVPDDHMDIINIFVFNNDFAVKDEIIKRFLADKFYKNIDKYDQHQKIDIVRFMFESN